MGLIRDLDGFVQFLENEASVGRLEKEKKEKIIDAIDIVQNNIKELNYKW